MKSVLVTSSGKSVKLGRLPRRSGGLRLHLSDFITHAALPPIPTSVDFGPKAVDVLSDIYENDQLGCCVVSAGYHVEGVATGNATGVPFHATNDQIIRDYSAIGGYVPGDPSTDNGCNESDAFSYWQSRGFANGTKLLGTISLNASNKADVMAALYLFENVFFGVGLPDAWISPFPGGNGFTWNVSGSSNPNNGHAFPGYGYGPNGVKIDTWGLLGTITWNAIAAYAGPSGGGELYSLLTPDILIKGQQKAPNGVAWGDLIAAFDSFGGNIPVPAPTPPSFGVTLAQAETAVQKAFSSRHMLMRPSTAAQVASKSLEGLSGWPK